MSYFERKYSPGYRHMMKRNVDLPLLRRKQYNTVLLGVIILMKCVHGNKIWVLGHLLVNMPGR